MDIHTPQYWVEHVFALITSWPFVVLVLGACLIRKVSRQQWLDLTKRIIGIGPGGVTLAPPPSTNQAGPERAEEAEAAVAARAQEQVLTPTVQAEQARLRQVLDAQPLLDANGRIEYLLTSWAYSMLAWKYERLASQIWKSQVDLLRFLAAQGQAEKGLLTYYYDEGRRRTPSFFERNSFDNYLGFLARWNLIAIDGDTVTIKDEGREFLRYMAQGNRPDPVWA